MRKMHVPAYAPIEFGAQDMEKRGVVVAEKKFMAIESIPIRVVVLELISISISIDIDMVVIVASWYL